jgi:hypothetical protein
MFQQIKRRGLFYRLCFYLERRVKEAIFDCHMCGQCVVRSTALVCPMQCPKQLRNGPCGGSMNGRCEVYPERRCVWSQIHERAARWPVFKEKFAAIRPAVDWALFGSSAWLNIWPERKIRADGKALSPAAVPAGNRWSAPADSAPEPPSGSGPR